MPRVVSSDGQCTAFIEPGIEQGEIDIRDIRFRSTSNDQWVTQETVTIEASEIDLSNVISEKSWPKGTTLYRSRWNGDERVFSETNGTGVGAGMTLDVDSEGAVIIQSFEGGAGYSNVTVDLDGGRYDSLGAGQTQVVSLRFAKASDPNETCVIDVTLKGRGGFGDAPIVDAFTKTPLTEADKVIVLEDPSSVYKGFSNKYTYGETFTENPHSLLLTDNGWTWDNTVEDPSSYERTYTLYFQTADGLTNVRHRVSSNAQGIPRVESSVQTPLNNEKVILIEEKASTFKGYVTTTITVPNSLQRTETGWKWDNTVPSPSHFDVTYTLQFEAEDGSTVERIVSSDSEGTPVLEGSAYEGGSSGENNNDEKIITIEDATSSFKSYSITTAPINLTQTDDGWVWDNTQSSGNYGTIYTLFFESGDGSSVTRVVSSNSGGVPTLHLLPSIPHSVRLPLNSDEHAIESISEEDSTVPGKWPMLESNVGKWHFKFSGGKGAHIVASVFDGEIAGLVVRDAGKYPSPPSAVVRSIGSSVPAFERVGEITSPWEGGRPNPTRLFSDFIPSAIDGWTSRHKSENGFYLAYALSSAFPKKDGSVTGYIEDTFVLRHFKNSSAVSKLLTNDSGSIIVPNPSSTYQIFVSSPLTGKVRLSGIAAANRHISTVTVALKSSSSTRFGLVKTLVGGVTAVRNAIQGLTADASDELQTEINRVIFGIFTNYDRDQLFRLIQNKYQTWNFSQRKCIIKGILANLPHFPNLVLRSNDLNFLEDTKGFGLGYNFSELIHNEIVFDLEKSVNAKSQTLNYSIRDHYVVMRAVDEDGVEHVQVNSKYSSVTEEDKMILHGKRLGFIPVHKHVSAHAIRFYNGDYSQHCTVRIVGDDGEVAVAGKLDVLRHT